MSVALDASHSTVVWDSVVQDEAKSSWLLRGLPYVPLLFMWPIAIAPKAVQLAIYVLIALLLVAHLGKQAVRLFKLDRVAVSLAALAIVQTLAVMINSSQAPSDRVLAACNTIAIWSVSTAVYFMYSNRMLDVGFLSRIATFNVLVCVILALGAARFDFSLSIMGEVRSLNGENWFDGSEGVRFFGLLEYSNLVTLMYLMLFPLSLLFVKRWKSLVLQFGYCLVATYPVYAASSRSGMLLSAIILFVSFAYLVSERQTRLSIGVILMFMCLAIALVLLIDWGDISDGAMRILSGRQASTSTRELVYELSLNRVLETSPIVGMGIKLIDSRLGVFVPLGSHSTYIGILYKTGIVGCVLALSAVLAILHAIASGNINRKNKVFVFACILILAVFLAVEDIDGTNWTLVTLAMLAGTLVSKCRTEENGNCHGE